MARKSDKQETKASFDTEKKVRQVLAITVVAPEEAATDAICSIFSQLKVDTECCGEVTGIDAGAVRRMLRAQNEALLNGDMGHVEKMLLDQSNTLQAIFTFYVQKMAGAEYMEQLDPYSRIALKAQNQCRQTLATLGELKNPRRATFIKQQNNAVNQQINQDGKQKENQKNSGDSANELLETLPNERLDTRTSQEAIRLDQEMETVGEIDRGKDTRRKT